MDEIREILREELKPVKEQLQVTNKILTGGDEPRKGIVVRLDRIEQTEKSRKHWSGLIAGVAITAFINSVLRWFR